MSGDAVCRRRHLHDSEQEAGACNHLGDQIDQYGGRISSAARQRALIAGVGLLIAFAVGTAIGWAFSPTPMGPAHPVSTPTTYGAPGPYGGPR